MHHKKIRAVFFGTSPFAAGILSDLAKKDIVIKLVITQPDRPAGRKQVLSPSPVKLAAKELSMPISQHEKLDDTALNQLSALDFDLGIVAAYGLIIPGAILKTAPFGFINVHPSLLPKYRGASPIQSALLAGEQMSGTSVVLMDKNVDSGPILLQKKVPVLPEDDYYELENKLQSASNEILFPSIASYLENKIELQRQNEHQATFTKPIKKEDGLIDWQKSSEMIYNAYRAFVHWPKIYSFYLDRGSLKKIIFEKVSLIKKLPPAEPAKIGRADNDIFVGTATDPLLLHKVTLEGSRTMDINDFIAGRPEFIGSILAKKP